VCVIKYIDCLSLTLDASKLEEESESFGYRLLKMLTQHITYNRDAITALMPASAADLAAMLLKPKLQNKPLQLFPGLTEKGRELERENHANLTASKDKCGEADHLRAKKNNATTPTFDSAPTSAETDRVQPDHAHLALIAAHGAAYPGHTEAPGALSKTVVGSPNIQNVCVSGDGRICIAPVHALPDPACPPSTRCAVLAPITSATEHKCAVALVETPPLVVYPPSIPEPPGRPPVVTNIVNEVVTQTEATRDLPLKVIPEDVGTHSDSLYEGSNVGSGGGSNTTVLLTDSRTLSTNLSTDISATGISATGIPAILANGIPATSIPATGSPATVIPATGIPATGIPATGIPAPVAAPDAGAPDAPALATHKSAPAALGAQSSGAAGVGKERADVGTAARSSYGTGNEKNESEEEGDVVERKAASPRVTSQNVFTVLTERSNVFICFIF
jgi:hypothetical protein